VSIDQKDVTNTICEYIKTENTNYAILLSGLWGSGKTYYWKNRLQEKIEETGFSTIYIYLNGLDKTEEIARKIVTSRWKSQTAGLVNVEALEKHKGLLSGALSNLGSIAQNLSSLAGVANSLVKIDLRPENMVDYIDFTKTVICFDDLERYSDIKKALGFINDFVEHRNTKVIILANEDEIKESLANIKEKVIGKTVKFALDKKEILNSMISSFPDDIRKVYLSEVDLIIEVMNSNKSCNYRVIKTILDDFYNIYKRSMACDRESFFKAQKPLLKYILAVGLEIRVNGISKEEKQLVRQSSQYSYVDWGFISASNTDKTQQQEPEKYHVKFKKRYYSQDFEPRYLFSSVLEYIDSGYLDIDEFIKEVLRYKEKEIPLVQYLTSIGFWKMSDNEFEIKIKRDLLKMIENGEIELALYPKAFVRYAYFQQNLLLDFTLQELEEKFYKGMKRIQETGTSDYRPYDGLVDKIDGELEEPYKRICEFTECVRLTLADKHYKKISSHFISYLREDVDKAIELTQDVESECQGVPIFFATTVDDVYRILLETPNIKIVNFQHMIINRYEYRNPYYEKTMNSDYGFIKNLAEYILKNTAKNSLKLLFQPEVLGQK